MILENRCKAVRHHLRVGVEASGSSSDTLPLERESEILQTLGQDGVGASRSRARSDLRVGRGGFLAWKGSAEQKGGDRANRQINPTERRLGGFRQIGGQGHSHAYRKVAKRANETAEQSQNSEKSPSAIPYMVGQRVPHPARASMPPKVMGKNDAPRSRPLSRRRSVPRCRGDVRTRGPPTSRA